METKPRNGVGVVIGRFQVHELHAGHRLLLNEAAKHGKMLAFIGVSKRLVTRDDPLDYPSRERMIREAYPKASMAPLYDQPTDEGWTRILDQTINAMFPTDGATLYGGRDSFKPHYKGTRMVIEIDEIPVLSGTEVREQVGNIIQNSRDWRAGAVYAAFNQYPRLNPCVDIAIIRKNEYGVAEVLLGLREHEMGKHRFPGGHIDTTDACAEDAAKREALEETGLEINNLRYVCQRKVDSWINTKNYIIYTTLFVADYTFGAAQAGDDLDKTKWVPVHLLESTPMVRDHVQLVKELRAFLAKERK